MNKLPVSFAPSYEALAQLFKYENLYKLKTNYGLLSTKPTGTAQAGDDDDGDGGDTAPQVRRTDCTSRVPLAALSFGCAPKIYVLQGYKPVRLGGDTMLERVPHKLNYSLVESLKNKGSIWVHDQLFFAS